MIYLLLMIEIINDVVVVVVMIEIFGKSLNWKGVSAQNFIFVLLFTSLLNFKWAQEFVLNTIVLIFNLEFSIKYQSHDIMDCCCMRFMLPEDLGNVNPMHEFICMYVECDWLWCWDEMILMLMIMLTWDDVDVDNDIEMRWY